MCVGQNIRNYIQYFLPLVVFSLCAFLLTVFVLSELSSYVYLLYCVFVHLLYYVSVYLLYCVFVYLLYLLFYSRCRTAG
jgi:Na+/H+-dicarboxylate symporter